MKRLLSLVLLAVVFVGCSKKAESPKKDGYVYEPVRIVSAYIPLVEKPDATRALLLGDEAKRLSEYLTNAGVKCFRTREGRFDLIVVSCSGMTQASCERLCESLSENGVVAWLMDVEGVTAEALLENFRGFSLAEAHLWMPGENRWVLVGRRTARKIRMSSMLEVFVRERAFDDLAKAKCGTLAEIFASYAGTANDYVPAFFGLSRGVQVGPSLFLTEKIPQIGWIDDSDLDEDIRKSLHAEIRSLQLMRREAVKASLLAAQATDKKGEEAVAEAFAKVMLRNPNELLVLERLDRLERNAKGFLSVGKVLLAMKCYETMVLIRPGDASAVHNFGMCLKKIGKLDLAEKILARAKALAEGKGADAPEKNSAR